MRTKTIIYSSVRDSISSLSLNVQNGPHDRRVYQKNVENGHFMTYYSICMTC